VNHHRRSPGQGIGDEGTAIPMEAREGEEEAPPLNLPGIIAEAGDLRAGAVKEGSPSGTSGTEEPHPFRQVRSQKTSQLSASS